MDRRERIPTVDDASHIVAVAVHNMPAMPARDCDCGSDDADYLRDAVARGEAKVIMDMIRDLDEVVALLGLQESERRPADELRRRFPELTNQ